MVITQITPTDENGKRQIYMDGQLFATLPADVVMSLDLHSGEQLDEPAVEALLIKAESLRAIQKAYTYLSYQALSRKKLGEKLQGAGFTAEAVEAALQRLEELGLVDDRALAQRLNDVMEKSKHWGPRRKAQELYKRGLGEQQLSTQEDPKEHIRYHLEHKYRKRDLSDPAQRRRVGAGLMRLGFDYEDIRGVMNEYNSDEFEDF